MSRNRLGIAVVVVFLVSMLGGVRSAPAQESAAPNRPSYGGTSDIYVPYSPSEFVPSSSSTVYSRTLEGGLTTSGVAAVFFAPVRLPSGVLLTSVELDFLENTSTPVEMELFSCQALHVSCTQIALLSSPGNAVGRGYVYQNLTPLNYTVDNFSKWLELRAFVYVPGTALLGAFLSYKLQVSPAPASATFADVPTNHPYFRFVEALASAGITGGCGGGNYCVNSPITRGEMAVFLAAALGLHFPN